MLRRMDYRTVLDQIRDGVYIVDPQRRIVFWNSGAEAISGFSRREVVGKSCADNLLVHVDDKGCGLCRNGCPLHATLADGAARQASVFLHHKLGHRIPVSVWVSPIRDESGAIAAAVEVFHDNTQDIALNRRLAEFEQLALLDPLTGLANRRYIDIHLKSCLDEWNRYKWPFSVLMFDLDHFKAVNDAHGHATGDEVLKMTSRVLFANLRSFDLAGRWGGEEFIAICLNLDAPRLHDLAERLRLLIQESALPHPSGPIRVTASIGAASAREGDSIQSILARADASLYKSKQTGRNRVTVDE